MAFLILKSLLVQMAGVGIDMRNNEVSLAGMPVEGPRTFNYFFYINPGKMRKTAEFNKVDFQETLQRSIRQAVKSEDDFYVRPASGPKGSFALEVGKPQSLWLEVTTGSLPRGSGLQMPVGIDLKGKPVRVDYGNPITPHAMVAGMPGSGKSNNMLYLIWRLASQNTPDEVKFIFIDTGKGGRDFTHFDNLSHLAHPTVTDQDEAAKVLSWLEQEKNRRDGVANPLPHLFVFVDEATSLMLKVPSAKDTLATLIREARSANIHVVTVFHNPTKENVVNRDIPTLSAMRLVGRVGDPTAAMTALGSGGTGAHRLTGSGDILVLNPAVTDNPVRVLTPRMIEGDYEILPRGGWTDLVGQVAVQSKGAGRNPDPITPEQYAHFLGKIAECVRDKKKPPTPEWIGKQMTPMMGPSKSQRAWLDATEIYKKLRAEGWSIR